jgi:hypothetical protein
MRLTHPIIVIAILVGGYAIWKDGLIPHGGRQAHAANTATNAAVRHVYDDAHALPPQDVPRFEQYMNWIVRESDVDVRIAFVSGTGGKSLDHWRSKRLMRYVSAAGRAIPAASCCSTTCRASASRSRSATGWKAISRTPSSAI